MTQEYPAAEHRLAMLKAKDTRIAALEAENFRLKQSAIAAQAPTAPPNGVPDHVFKAINLAATAVYLDDSSAFSGALWGVIEALSPELYEAMRDNPHAGYQSLPDICPPTAMPLPVQAEPQDLEGLAHKIYSAAQLAPGEGVIDGVDRIVDLLGPAAKEPLAQVEAIAEWLELQRTDIPALGPEFAAGLRHQFGITGAAK